MHPLIFLAIMLAALGASSYGVMLMPLEPIPKQVAHMGLVLGFLAALARFYGIM